jgi:D-arabinose 5-phosphate isomerase GutQ
MNRTRPQSSKNNTPKFSRTDVVLTILSACPKTWNLLTAWPLIVMILSTFLAIASAPVSSSAQNSPVPDLNIPETPSIPLSRIPWVPGQTGVWIAGDAPAAYLIRATAGKQLRWQILKGNPQINAYFVDGSEIIYGGTLRAEGDIRLEIRGTDYSLYITIE